MNMAKPDIPDGFVRTLGQCAVIGSITFAARVTHYRFHYGWKDSVVWPGLLFVAITGLLWQAVVTLWVPEPYLDEVFHIPQAQKYCQLQWHEWDDKITTPPGLHVFTLPPPFLLLPFNHASLTLPPSYLASFALQKLMLLTGPCTPLTLRLTNWLALLFLALASLQCRRLLEARLAERASGGKASRPPYALSVYAVHTGANVALFPLLFFFSGLYYTDVFATLAVLGAFWVCLERVGLEGKGWRGDLLVVGVGVGGLVMRQTNVFWVVVFMGGLEAVHAVRSREPVQVAAGESVQETLVRYSQGNVHDPVLSDAGLEDVFYCAASLAIGVICNPFRVLKQIWAHIVVGLLFGAFIVLNGGVVLGDKANHIATIHLPQMLYIWPLFAFFSAPLVLPWALQTASDLFFGGQTPTPPTEQSQRPKPSAFANFLNLAGYASLAPIALAIIKLNTIIHPFTLADNRHYMFYVFRYTILRAPWLRFGLVPAYIGCGILCLKTLAGYGPDPQAETEPQEAQNAANPPNATVAPASDDKTSHPNPAKPSAIHDHLPAQTSTAHLSPSLSTALLWLLATALSLITAPLVEPRYFILPWVFWRLLVPAWAAPAAVGRRYDLRLWVESAWFVVVNVATMYIFVTRPFYWYAPDGGLADAGRVQRFMW